MQALVDSFPSRNASSVEGPEIAAVRDAIIRGEGGDGKPYVRAVTTVNDRLYLIKQAFLWGRERGMVSKDNLFDIMQVKPLRAGRCDATPPQQEVTPVDEHLVAVVKPYCSSPVS